MCIGACLVGSLGEGGDGALTSSGGGETGGVWILRALLLCPGTRRPLVWSEQADGFSGAATVVIGPRAGKLCQELVGRVST